MPATLFTSETGRYHAKLAANRRAEAANYRRCHPEPKKKTDYSTVSLSRLKAQLDAVNERIMENLTRRPQTLDAQTCDRLARMQFSLIEQLRILSDPKLAAGPTPSTSDDDISPAVEQ